MRKEIEIRAPIEQVYAVTTDPETVPFYAPEIVCIELVKRLTNRETLVKSHLKVGSLTFVYPYRYHYHPPKY